MGACLSRRRPLTLEDKIEYLHVRIEELTQVITESEEERQFATEEVEALEQGHNNKVG